MRPPRRLVIVVAVAVAAVTAGSIVFSAADPDDRGSTLPARPPVADLRGCAERVEGGRIRADPARDTIIGPVAFSNAPSAWRDQSVANGHRPASYEAGLNGYPIKLLLLVEAGELVTLEVPRAQRRWMRLHYVHGSRTGQHAIALQACRRHVSRATARRECAWKRGPYTACRWHNTQFNGGVSIDFARAPAEGRCAELLVWHDGSPRPVRRRLFDRTERGACG